MPLVSVVIPAFNAERTLARAIDSALAQDGVDLEILVCDDGSTDGTADVLAAYGDRVVPLKQANRGRGAARNACVERAAGAYHALLDADDWWAAGKLARQLAAADAQPDRDVFYGNAYVVDQQGTIYQTMNGEWHVGHSGRVFPFLVRQNFVPTSTLLVRRAAVERAGLFDTSLPRCQDLEWLLRLSITSEFHYDPTPLAFYDDQNHGTDEKLTATYANYLALLAKTEAAHPDLAFRHRALFDKSASDACYAIGTHLASKGRFAEAAGQFALALERTPRLRAVRWHHALALYRAGAMAPALEAFRQYAHDEPYDVDAHFYIGNASLELGDLDRARSSFEFALYGGYLYQKFPECVNNLGVVHALMGDAARARELWTQAVEQRPMYSDAIRNLQLPPDSACGGQARWTRRRVF